MTPYSLPWFLIGFAAIGLSACQSEPAAKSYLKASANLSAKSGSNASGQVTMTQTNQQVKLVATLKGLSPNASHGFHIHEKGDCSAADASSAGAHFNPHAAQHGNRGSEMHHLGDMPNIVADSQGNAQYQALLTDVDLSTGSLGILGRALVVHKNADDYVSQPAGNAGPRIACGLIQ